MIKSISKFPILRYKIRKIFKYAYIWLNTACWLLWCFATINGYFNIKFFASRQFCLIFIWTITLICIFTHWPKNHFEYKLNWRDIRIGIKIWDISKSDNIIIPINNRFDVTQTCIKNSKSVLNSVLNNWFWWNTILIDSQLKNKNINTNKEYDMWKIVGITGWNNKNWFLLANTRVNQNWRSYCNPDDLGKVLSTVFINLKDFIDKKSDIAIPIISSWHGWLPLTRIDIIYWIIDSFIAASKDDTICEKLTVYLAKEDVKNNNIDLVSLDEYLKILLENYREKKWTEFNKYGTPIS